MTLDPNLKSRILQAVEDGFAEQVSFTQQLVQTPSLRGHEHAYWLVVYYDCGHGFSFSPRRGY